MPALNQTRSLYSPVLADFNSDGAKDIVVIEGSFSDQVSVFNGKGEQLPGWPWKLSLNETRPISAPAVGDIEGDGPPEIAFVTEPVARGNKLFLLRSDGTSVPGWPQALPQEVPYATAVCRPVLADLDADGDLEIISGLKTRVFAFHRNGSMFGGWPRSILPPGAANRYSYLREMVTGDVDGDGKPEIIASVITNEQTGIFISFYEEQLYAWRADGTLLPGWPVKQPMNSAGPPVLVDLDGDGKSEVIVAMGPYSLAEYQQNLPSHFRVYRWDGTLFDGISKPTAISGFSDFHLYSPVFADIDGDGFLEMAWIDRFLDLYVWDLDTPKTNSRPWPMARRDAQLTGCLKPVTPLVPRAPSNLSSNIVSTTQVRLRWDETSANEKGFKIERKSGSGDFAEVAVVGINAVSYDDPDLTPGTAYLYRVRAYNEGGFSGYSNEVPATPPLTPTLAVPANLTVTAVSATQINLSWADDSTSEIRFKIERRTATTPFAEIAVVGANVTGYQDTGLNPRMTYYYQVRASSVTASSGYSNEAHAVTPPSPKGAKPVAPSDLQATEVSSSGVTLTWEDNSDNETGFEITRLRYPFWEKAARVRAGVTSWKDSRLKPETHYIYHVASYNAAGGSDSVYVHITTPPDLPPVISGITVSDVNHEGAKLIWTTNEPADSTVEFGTTTAYGRIKSKPGRVRNHHIELKNMPRGAAVYFRVKSKDRGGNVGVSEPLSFQTTPR